MAYPGFAVPVLHRSGRTRLFDLNRRFLDEPDVKPEMWLCVPIFAALKQDFRPMIVSQPELLQPHAFAKR